MQSLEWSLPEISKYLRIKEMKHRGIRAILSLSNLTAISALTIFPKFVSVLMFMEISMACNQASDGTNANTAHSKLCPLV